MKKNENTLYKMMNIVFFVAALFFLTGIAKDAVSGGWQTVGDFKSPILSVFLCFLCFLILHAAKLMRFYLVLMEQRMEFKRFVKVYIKTTFVNFLLPFKSGELFRIYCFAHETRNVRMGFISVIVDRMFDTCVLLLFLLPYDFCVVGRISAVTVILSLIVLLVLLGCVFLYSSYNYLNRFLMINGNSKRTIWFLQMLENFKMCYDYMAALLKGRFFLILIFSCFGWIFEFLFLKFMAGTFNIAFGMAQFAEYIGGIFSADTGILKNNYILVSALGLLVAMIICYFYYFCYSGSGLKNRRSENA